MGCLEHSGRALVVVCVCDLADGWALRLAGSLLRSEIRSFIFRDFKNGQTLQVLDLGFCEGIDLKSIQYIVKNCDKLVEVNFGATVLSQESINYLVSNLSQNVC